MFTCTELLSVFSFREKFVEVPNTAYENDTGKWYKMEQYA